MNIIGLDKLRELEKKLSLCPFCNGKAGLLTTSDSPSSFRAFCKECFITTTYWSGQGNNLDGAKLAIDHWNSRNDQNCRLGGLTNERKKQNKKNRKEN